MLTSIDQTKWYDRIWASLIFFTRLPFWRLHQPPRECYSRVVEHWPLVGWLTAGVMAATLYFGSMVMPYPVAVLLAIAARLLLTGALHEDGLADFFDGFGGGGNDRQRILDIMKDSHIGTYGVLGLILYLALLAGWCITLAGTQDGGFGDPGCRSLRQDGGCAADPDDALRPKGGGGEGQDGVS